MKARGLITEGALIFSWLLGIVAAAFGEWHAVVITVLFPLYEIAISVSDLSRKPSKSPTVVVNVPATANAEDIRKMLLQLKRHRGES